MDWFEEKVNNQEWLIDAMNEAVFYDPIFMDLLREALLVNKPDINEAMVKRMLDLIEEYIKDGDDSD